MPLVVRWAINAAALFVAAWLVPGIHLGDHARARGTTEWLTLGAVAPIFGVVNVVIRPLLVLLTLPLTFVTLGLFIFIVNALMLLVTSAIAQALGLGFRVDGFFPALLGSLVISVVSFVLHRFVAGD